MKLHTGGIRLLAIVTLLAAALIGLETENNVAQPSRAKISGALQLLLNNQGNPGAVQALGQAQGVEVKGNDQRLVVVVEGTGDLGANIGAKGGKILAKYKGFWQVELPLSEIPPVAKNSVVDFVRLPLSAQLATPLSRFQLSDNTALGPFPQMVPQQAPIISEGVNLIGADALHAQGITGKGVKVAVIDLQFGGLDEIIQQGELPESVVAWNCLGTPTDPNKVPVCRKVSPAQLSQASAGVHGTAVAEIVHDVAPDAEMHLFLVSTAVELGQALEQALGEGIQVVNHSVGWFNDGSFYDGKGKAGDIVKAARQNGIFWVNAAGNAAQEHYEAVFKDADGDKFHDEVIRFKLQEGEQLTAQLSWDAWPATDENFDLILEQVNKEVSGSKTLQNGTEPKEAFQFTATATDDYRLRIRWADANLNDPPTDRKMELFLTISSSAAAQIEPDTPQSSLPAPANARETFVVGAVGVQQWPEGKLEPFSSQGPSNGGFTKPDLVAPDCVRTASMQSVISRSFCGDDGLFPGTSAAAPHVAGMAALLLSKDPSLSPRQLEKLLKKDATPVPSLTANQGGSGQANLLPQTDRPDLIVDAVNVDTTEVLDDGPVVLNVTIDNVGALDAGPFWIVLWRVKEEGVNGSELVSKFVREGLKAGEKKDIVLEWFPEAALQNENWVVVLDPFGDVKERNPNNNRKELSVVPPVPPSPAILEVQFEGEALAFAGLEGDNSLDPHPLTVRNTGGSTLSWTASADQSWLTVSPTRGDLAAGAQATVTVTANPSGISAGTQNGVVTVVAEAVGVQGSPVRVPVTLDIVKPGVLRVDVNGDQFSFDGRTGDPSIASQSFALSNDGGQALKWSAASNQSWVTLSPSQGTLGAGERTVVEVGVDATSLAAGTHTATITVVANGDQSSEVRIPVITTLSVQPGVLEVSSTSFNLQTPVGGRGQASKKLTISNTGGQKLQWTLKKDADWLLTGVDGGTLEVGESLDLFLFVEAKGLAVGTFKAKITLTSSEAEGSPIEIEVTLTVSSS